LLRWKCGQRRSDTVTPRPMNQARIDELEREIADLKGRWPKHSVKPSMFLQLEELEDALEKALAEKGDGG
jgi:hypothetical protein